jgi:hypothetical protein
MAMIYFLINNDYHYFDVALHAQTLEGTRLHLIEIMHTLQQRDSSRWATSSRFEPVIHSGLARALLSHLQTVPKIAARIRPRREDVLFVYTEYEPLNQYVVGLFRRAGARVYLIEDGGIATYITFRNPQSEPLRLKERVLRALYRCLPGAGSLRLQKIGGNLYPWMPDDCFDGVCLYRPVRLGRKLPVVPLRRPAEPCIVGADTSRILFLNQDLYTFNYLSDDAYIETLRHVIGGLASGFGQVLFKFHPRETAAWRERIQREVLSRWINVSCISSNLGIEATIEDSGVGLAASFNSTALMNLVHRGIEPVFLYHLFPQLTRHADFRENTAVLQEIGYQFVDAVTAVTPQYRSGLAEVDSDAAGRLSIGQIVAGSR